MSASEDNSTFQNNSNSTNGICGLCGRKDLKLVLVDSEEAIENDLSNKIELYIPINLDKFKNIPVECCSECMKTILSWHDFVINVLEVNKKPLDSSSVEPSTVSGNEDSEKRTENIISFQHEDSETSNQEIPVSKDGTDDEAVSFIFTDGETSEQEDITSVHSFSTKNTKTEPDYPFKSEDHSVESEKPKKKRRKKNDGEVFICGTCDRSFSRKHDMERHKKLKHGETDTDRSRKRGEIKEMLAKFKVAVDGETMYQCNVCQRRFRQCYNLFTHMTLHTGEKPYVCHYCGKNFRLDTSYKKHIKFHEGVKNYKCEICNRRFGTKFVRDEHYNIHTDVRPYNCVICQKAFKQKSTLRVHLMLHEKNFQCSLCDEKFRRPQELEIHQYIHTGQKPFKCEICDNSFNRNQDLKRHMAAHSKNKMEWVCAICESSFHQEKMLSRHLKIHLEGDLEEG